LQEIQRLSQYSISSNYSALRVTVNCVKAPLVRVTLLMEQVPVPVSMRMRPKDKRQVAGAKWHIASLQTDPLALFHLTTGRRRRCRYLLAELHIAEARCCRRDYCTRSGVYCPTLTQITSGIDLEMADTACQ